MAEESPRNVSFQSCGRMSPAGKPKIAVSAASPTSLGTAAANVATDGSASKAQPTQRSRCPVHDSSLALRAARRSSSVTPATPRSGIGVK